MIMQRENSNNLFKQKNLSPNLLLESFFSRRMRDDIVYTTRNKAKYGFGRFVVALYKFFSINM